MYVYAWLDTIFRQQFWEHRLTAWAIYFVGERSIRLERFINYIHLYNFHSFHRIMWYLKSFKGIILTIFRYKAAICTDLHFVAWTRNFYHFARDLIKIFNPGVNHCFVLLFLLPLAHFLLAWIANYSSRWVLLKCHKLSYCYKVSTWTFDYLLDNKRKTNFCARQFLHCVWLVHLKLLQTWCFFIGQILLE